MSDPKAFVFDGAFPTSSQPFKVHGNDGGALIIEWPQVAYGIITNLYAAGKGKRLRIMVEIED